MDPIISLYGASKYPSNILDVSRSLGNNQVPFEVIFAGPTLPSVVLRL